MHYASKHFIFDRIQNLLKYLFYGYVSEFRTSLSVIPTETHDNDTALTMVGVLVPFFKLPWDIVVFRLVSHLLSIFCSNLRFVYKFYI